METFIHHTAKIHPSAVIYDPVIICENVEIGPFCIIGAAPEWKGNEHKREGVIICYNTKITGAVTIDSGAENATYIGHDCFIMKMVHLGHDVIVKDNVTIACGAKIGGHSVIGNNSNIGLNASVHQKLSIPEGCMIGMGAVVTKKTELQPNSKYVGNPARYLSPNIKK